MGCCAALAALLLSAAVAAQEADGEAPAAPMSVEVEPVSAELFAPAASVELDASPLRLDADLSAFEAPLWSWWASPLPQQVHDPLIHQLRLTWEGAKSWVAIREVFGQKTASPPLFGTTNLINITGSCLWLNMLPTLTQGSPLHLGPYLDNWQSVRSSFEGHYGVQLRMGW